MAKKRSKSREKASLNLGEIDRFLDDASSTPEDRDPSSAPSAPKAAPDAEPTPESTDAEADPTLPEAEPPRALSIDIPDDGLLAIIRAIHPDTTLEFVLEFLGQNGVTFGTDEDTIRKAIDQAKDSGQPVRDVAVAKGVEPRHPAPPRMEHRPPGGLDSLPGLGPVAKALKLESPQELVESVKDLTVLPVASGDTLAELVHDAGEPGKNVRGEAVDPPPIETEMESEALQPGSGVDRDGDGRYHATHWGYAGVLEGKVTVLAPIWIAPDGMVASLLHRPYEGPEPSSPTVDDLTTALGSCNVTVGIEPDWLQKVVDRLAEGTVVRIMVPLARGVEPESSEDGRIDFSFPPDTLAGTIAADGSINLKERNLFPGFEEGELLAETVPPVVGTPGKSVRDEIVEIDPPLAVELVAGENTRLEEKGDVQKIFSGITGGASVKTVEISGGDGKKQQSTVSVKEVAQVSGDVNYETGNLDHKGNIDIKGSVLGGFSVRARGDIIVGGAIEDGASLECEGSLTVKMGIFGENTEVRSGGDITAKFIQDATVHADGNINIGSYVHTASVHSGKRVVVEGGGGSGGGIIGGETWAVEGITTKNCGSQRSATTFVAVGVNRDLYIEYDKARRTAAKGSTLLSNLMRAIGVKSLESEAIKKLVAQQPRRANEILHYVKKANELSTIAKENEEKEKALHEQIDRTSEHATLDVGDVAYERVRLRIGNREVRLDEDRKGVRYLVQKKDDAIEITYAALSPEGSDDSKKEES
jgi:uncharacterized protein (DUF342 family)